MRHLFYLAGLCCLLACQADGPAATPPAPAPTAPATAPSAVGNFESEIEAFELRDADAGMPAPGGAVLVGSSSIRLWHTAEKDLAPLPVVRRGFGGARIDDVLHYMDRVVLPYRPSLIVFFAGTNDLAGNEDDYSPGTIRSRYQDFVRRVHAELPDTDIYFISITPSEARKEKLAEVRQTNDLIEAYSATDPKLHFFDLEEKFLNANGTVNTRLFATDNLHLNADGYRVWKDAMYAPLMRAYMAKPRVQ